MAAASYAYPGDGSVVVTGAVEASATHEGREDRERQLRRAPASNVSIFDGEITADSVSAGSSAAAGARTARRGVRAAPAVANLQALGRPHAFGRATLGDWGYLVISRHTVDRTAPTGTKGYDGDVRRRSTSILTAPHGGLPAGSEIQIGYAAAGVETAPPVVPESGPAAWRPTPAPAAGDRRR